MYIPKSNNLSKERSMNSRHLGLALTLSVAFAVVACSDNDDKNPASGSGKGGSKSAGCNFTVDSKTWEFSQVLPGSGTTIPATYKYTFGSGSNYTQTVSVYTNDASAKTTCDNIDAIREYSDVDMKCENGMLVTTTTSEMDYTDYGYSSKQEFFQATMAACKAALANNEGDDDDDYGDWDDGDDYDDYSCTKEGAKKKIEGIDAVCHDGEWIPALMLESCVNGKKTVLGQGVEAIPFICENGEWVVDYETLIEQMGGESYYDDY